MSDRLDAPAAAPPVRGRVALLLAAALAAVVGAMSSRDLWAPDEPRYGQVAREMLETGEWLVPHVNAEPYAEKPPVWYWWAALLSMPGGDVTPATARLASALLAAGAVLLIARLGRVLFGDPSVGDTAALLFASTGLVLWNAPRAGLDLPLTFFVLLAVERASVWAVRGGWGAAALAGVAWAGAILVKGPVGFFLPPLVLGAGLIGARRAPRPANPGWWLMPLLMAGLCLAWLLPATAAGGEAYTQRLLGQIGSRATGEEAGHVRGPFYYLLRAAPLFLPWSLHLLAGLLALGTFRREADPGRRFALAACGVGSVGFLLILSAFGTKRELYMIPGLPFAALLAAYAVHRGLFPRVQAWGRILAVVCLAGVAVAVLGLPWGVAIAGRVLEMPALGMPGVLEVVAALLAAVGLGLLARHAWRIRPDAVAPVRLVAVALLAGAVLLHVLWLPRLDPVKSFAVVAREAEAASGGGPIYIAGWDQGPNLLWSLHRDRVGTLDEATIAEVLAPGSPPAAVVVEARWWGLQAHLPAGARVAWRGRTGNRTLLVVTPPE